MTLSAAISTPRPLPRQREHAETRNALAQLRAVPAQLSNSGDKGSGLAPAQAIQTMEGESDSRLANQSRIESLRVELRLLVEAITHAANVEVLDLMRNETGSFSRYKAAEETRTWASDAGRQLEIGLMMLDRALRPATR